MASTTTNYGLKKPDLDEFYDLNVQNENMDKIDEELKNRETAQTTHENNHQNPHMVTADQVHAVPSAKVGKANGVASLDSSGKVPESQLPSMSAEAAINAHNENELAHPSLIQKINAVETVANQAQADASEALETFVYMVKAVPSQRGTLT